VENLGPGGGEFGGIIFNLLKKLGFKGGRFGETRFFTLCLSSKWLFLREG